MTETNNSSNIVTEVYGIGGYLVSVDCQTLNVAT